MGWQFYVVILLYVILIGLFIWREIIVSRLARENTELKAKNDNLQHNLDESRAFREELYSRYMASLAREARRDGK